MLEGAESGESQNHPAALTSRNGIPQRAQVSCFKGLSTPADTQGVFSTTHLSHTMRIWQGQWPLVPAHPVFPSFLEVGSLAAPICTHPPLCSSISETFGSGIHSGLPASAGHLARLLLPNYVGVRG